MRTKQVGGRKEPASMKSLHGAVADESLDLVKSLLADGADIDERDKDGDTALYLAASKGNKEIGNCLPPSGSSQRRHLPIE